VTDGAPAGDVIELINGIPSMSWLSERGSAGGDNSSREHNKNKAVRHHDV